MRYENKKRLINSHIAAIFAIPPMVTVSAVDLKKILVNLKTPLAALKVLGRPVDTWDDWLIFHTISLFDNDTKRQWELYLCNLSLSSQSVQIQGQSTPPTTDNSTIVSNVNFNSEPPTFKILNNFANKNNQNSNSNFNVNSSNYGKSKNTNVITQPQVKVFHTQLSSKNNNNNKIECLMCKGNHKVLNCSNYKKLTPAKRYDFIKSIQRCCNCLGNHLFTKCTPKELCNICKKKHYTSLHDDNYVSRFQKKPQNSNNSDPFSTQNGNQNLSQNTHNANFSEAGASTSASSLVTSLNLCGTPSQTLLSTAVVKVVNENGYELYARALVDQASQASFISQSLFKRLCSSHSATKLPVSGVGGKNDYTCTKMVQFHIKPRFMSDFSLMIEASA